MAAAGVCVYGARSMHEVRSPLDQSFRGFADLLLGRCCGQRWWGRVLLSGRYGEGASPWGGRGGGRGGVAIIIGRFTRHLQLLVLDIVSTVSMYGFSQTSIYRM